MNVLVRTCTPLQGWTVDSFLNGPLDIHSHRIFRCENRHLRWSRGRDCWPAAWRGIVAGVVVRLAIHGGDGRSCHIQACRAHTTHESIAYQGPNVASHAGYCTEAHKAQELCLALRSARLVPEIASETQQTPRGMPAGISRLCLPSLPMHCPGAAADRNSCVGAGAPQETIPWARSRFWRSCGLMAARRATCPSTAALLAAEGWTVTV